MRSEPEILAGMRVLVAEDEYFLADDLAQALGRIGARVVGPVATVDDAARSLRAGTVDCAVLDIDLRGNSVYQIASRLRADGVPFIFSTGYERVHVDAAFADVPVYQKPVEAAQLLRALSEVLRAG